MASRKSASVRVNIYMPRTLHKDAKTALKRRAQIAAASGQKPATKISGWVQEQATALVAMFK